MEEGGGGVGKDYKKAQKDYINGLDHISGFFREMGLQKLAIFARFVVLGYLDRKSNSRSFCKFAFE